MLSIRPKMDTPGGKIDLCKCQLCGNVGGSNNSRRTKTAINRDIVIVEHITCGHKDIYEGGDGNWSLSCSYNKRDTVFPPNTKVWSEDSVNVN